MLHIYKSGSRDYRNNERVFTASGIIENKNPDCFFANKGSEWDAYRSVINEVVFHDKAALKPTSFEGWFAGCSALSTFDADGSINTTAATSMKSMFEGCTSLTSLNLKKWNVSGVTNMDNMFKGCSQLEKIYASSFDVSAVSSSTDMFAGCISIVGGFNTHYDAGHIDKEYACIDLPARPGYFEGDVTADTEYRDIMVVNITSSNGNPGRIYYYDGIFYTTRSEAVTAFLNATSQP